jgi:hypothetical protein
LKDPVKLEFLFDTGKKSEEKTGPESRHFVIYNSYGTWFDIHEPI